VEGRVARVDPAAQNGTVLVDVSFTGPLPKGARPDLSVDGTIELEPSGWGTKVRASAETGGGLFDRFRGPDEAQAIERRLTEIAVEPDGLRDTCRVSVTVFYRTSHPGSGAETFERLSTLLTRP